MSEDLLQLHKPTLRVLSILETIAKHSGGLTLSEIAVKVDCPKSTITPILKTLVQRDYLQYNLEMSTYSIGRKNFLLGSMYQCQQGDTIDIFSLIREQMESMVELSKETCHLGILSGNEIMYLQKVSSPKPIQLLSSIGKRLPAYATALGKALLIDYSQEELEALFPEPLKSLTPKTLITIEDLYMDIHRDRTGRFTYEFEEITQHARCIATPLRVNGTIVAALSISFLVFDGTKEHVDNIKDILRVYSCNIEKLMAQQNWHADY